MGRLMTVDHPKLFGYDLYFTRDFDVYSESLVFTEKAPTYLVFVISTLTSGELSLQM